MSNTVPLYGFGGGGGASLNFSVVGNPQPADPKANTIWVDTDVDITGWHFIATQPENLAEGNVWFSVGTSSTTPFNALKKNGIAVYPLSAKQYVNGVLVDKTAKIYQNGVWGELDPSVFIRNGDLIRNLNASARAGSRATVKQMSGYVEVKNPVATSTAVLHDTLVDVTNYTKLTLYADVISVYKDGGGNPKVGPVLAKALNASSYSNMLANIVAGGYTKNKGVQTLVCDISSLSGKYYAGIILDGGDEGYPELKAYDLYLS